MSADNSENQVDLSGLDENTANTVRAMAQGKIGNGSDSALDALGVFLDSASQRAAVIGRVFERSGFAVLAWLLWIPASVFAWRAWPKFLEVDGASFFAALAGVLVVTGLKLGANAMVKYLYNKDGLVAVFLGFGLFLGVGLNTLASTELQATMELNNTEEMLAIKENIDDLKSDRALLKAKTLHKPKDRSNQINAQMNLILDSSAENSRGTQLDKTVRSLVGECDDPDSYYVRVYCPQLGVFQAELQDNEQLIADYDADVQKIVDIEAKIEELEISKPELSGGTSIVAKVLGEGKENIAAALKSVVYILGIELSMMFFAGISGFFDARRNNQKPSTAGVI